MSEWLECRACRKRRNRVLSVVALAMLLAVGSGAALFAVVVGGPNFGVVGTCGSAPRVETAEERACVLACGSSWTPEAVQCTAACNRGATDRDAQSNRTCAIETQLLSARVPLFAMLAVLFTAVAFASRKRIREVVRRRRAHGQLPFRDAFRCPDHGEIKLPLV